MQAGKTVSVISTRFLGSAWRKYLDVCITDLDEACFHVRGCRDCPVLAAREAATATVSAAEKNLRDNFGYPAMHEAHASLYAFHTRRFPSAFAGRKDGRRFCLRPVEAHDEVDRAVRGGEPVGFLVSTR